MISALQGELTNLYSIHTSYKPLILTATQLLRKEPTFNSISPFKRHTRRSLPPFLGDALSWFTGTATTKDVSSIKNRVNQLIAMQHKQQETLVHIISVLNVTRCATQVNRQHINLVMDTVERTHQDITMLYNITSSLYTSLKLPADCTAHPLYSGKAQRFTISYETSYHACDGLHRCSHNWYTITACTPSRTALENISIHHQRGTTFNHALSSFIRGYTSFL